MVHLCQFYEERGEKSEILLKLKIVWLVIAIQDAYEHV